MGLSPVVGGMGFSHLARCWSAVVLSFGIFSGRGWTGEGAAPLCIHVLGWLPKNRVLVEFALADSPASRVPPAV